MKSKERIPREGAAPSGAGRAVLGSFVLSYFDPRLRLISALGFALVTVALASPVALAASLAIALGLVSLSELSFRRLAARLLPLEALLAALVISLAFSVPGEPWLHLGSATVSVEGLTLALIIALRVNAVFIALLALFSGLQPTALAHALAALRLSPRLVNLMLLTVRQIDLLLLEFDRLRRAMRARAFAPRANLHTWRSLSWLIGMLLVRSFSRARRLDAAMRCRCFRGRFYPLDDPVWQGRDTLAAFAWGILLGLLILLGWHGGGWH